MRKNSKARFAVAGCAAAILIALWSVRDRFRPIGAGSPAPNFAAALESGARMELSDFGADVVLLNVWATWCAPCKDEMPSIQRLYDEFSRDELEIAAISIDAGAGLLDLLGRPGGDPFAFADSLGLTFPILVDPEGRIQRLYRTSGVPESFVIGPDRTIYKKIAGPTEWDSPANRELVRRLASR